MTSAMIFRRLLAMGLALIAGAALAAGCGSSDADGGASTDPEEALADIQAALADGDGAAACGALTPTGRYELDRLRTSTPAGGCERVVEEIGERADKPGWDKARPTLQSLTVDGKWAIARVPDAYGNDTVVPLARRPDGKWALTSLSLLDADAIDAPPYGETPEYDEPARYTPPEVVYDVQTDILRHRVQSVCDDLTRAARRAIEATGEGDDTCETRLAEIVARDLAEGLQPLSSRVVAVRGNGERRTLIVKDIGGPRRKVPIVREEGRWRLTDVRHAVPIELR
jgi:hypothetical protein